MARRHTGHVRNVWLQVTHETKCPHGMQAKRFSSLPQSVQGLLTNSLVSAFVASIFTCSMVVSTVIGSTTADVWFVTTVELLDAVAGTAEETGSSWTKVSKDKWAIEYRSLKRIVYELDCSPSRIDFILMLGTMIFSLFPLIHSICFWRMRQAM